MELFYIYQKDMYGCDFVDDTILAKNKEEAENIFFNKNGISDEDTKWLFYAVSKQKADENERLLKETGYSSWDEYYADMYPQRPIEL